MLNKPRRRGLAAAGIAVAASALAWTSLASGAGSSSAPNRVVVKAVMKGNQMAYVLSGDSIQSGGKLVIKDPSGAPHTLSLVTKNLVPRTRAQMQNCFKTGHICRAIAKWHKAPNNGPPKVNPVDVGKPGWDTEGNLNRKGDSVFFTPKKPAATRVVSAAPGTTLHFICAVHPEMHGTLHVK